MKQALQHIFLLFTAVLLTTVSIKSVSADPDDLDDFSITHHCSPVGEFQHQHTFHFDNQFWITEEKTFDFSKEERSTEYIDRHKKIECRVLNDVWQPPRLG